MKSVSKGLAAVALVLGVTACNQQPAPNANVELAKA